MAEPPTENEGKPSLIVAVDFGTTYSGICYAYSNDTDIQRLVKDWPFAKFESEKVPTKMAYSEDCKIEAWGFGIDAAQPSFQEFKLLLDKSRPVNHSSLSQRLTDSTSLTCSERLTPCKLTIDFLKELRKCLECRVDGIMGTGAFGSMTVEYVITVPAIWSDAAKDLTKFCAQQAGMGRPKLIAEPEAAMVHALQDSPAEFFNVGDTYIICDAGGGTVDLITYRVTSTKPLEVEEVVRGDGDRCGSAYVTRSFRDYILKHSARIPCWTEQNTLTAVEQFDGMAKRRFDGENTDVVIKVKGAQDYYTKDIKIVKQKMFLKGKIIQAIFNQVVPTLFDLVKEQRFRALKKGANVHGVILVGGFCESPYLKRYLKNKLRSLDKTIKIIEPKHGWSAVVRGALNQALPIVAAHHPIPQIVSRVARCAYGITNSRRFNSIFDPEGKKFYVASHSCYYIEQILWFLPKGAPIEKNYSFTRHYEHSWRADSDDPRDSTIYLNIVSCDSTGRRSSLPRYAHSPGVVTVNKLNVDLGVIPQADLNTKWRHDVKYYECYPDVRITYLFAAIRYQLYIGHKCYGEIQSKIEA